MTVLVVHVGVVLLLAVAGLLLRRRPEVAHLLWVLVFVKLLVPPFLEVAVLPGIAHGSLVGEIDSGLAMTPSGTVSSQPTLPAVPFTGESAGRVVAAVAAEPTDWWGLALAASIPVWLAGCFGFLAWTAWSLWRFRAWLRAGEAPSRALRSRIRRLSDAVGLRRAPRCQVIDAAISPAVMPGFVPLLLLPAALVDDLDDEALDSVIVHELVHLLRRDHWVRCLELVVLASYWWCPPVWWFRRWLRATEETSCDRRVLRLLPGRAKAYATALIEAAAVLGRARPNLLPRLATGMGAIHPLTERLEMIMKYRSTPPLTRGLRLALLVPALGLVPLLPVQAASQDPAPLPEPPSERPLDPESSRLAQDPVRQRGNRAAEPAMSALEREWLREYASRADRGEHAAALAWFAAQRTANSSAAYDLSLAGMRSAAGEFEAASRVLEDAVTKAPDFARAWRLLGITNFRLGRHEAARFALRKVVDLGVADGTTYGALANAAFAIGDYEQAETAYWLANLREPESREWKLGLLRVFFATKRYAEAVELANRALDDREQAGGESTADIVRVKANALLALGRTVEAADLLLRLEPDTSRERLLRAASGLRTPGHVEQSAALRAVLQAIDPVVAPESAGGVDHGLDARTRAAVELAARSPRDVAALLALGRLYSHAGKFVSAVRCFERAVALEPQRADAYVPWAQALAELGRTDEAVDLLGRASALELAAGEDRADLATYLRTLRKAADRGATFGLAEVEEQPRLLQSVAPEVPAKLREYLPANVRVQFVITRQGRVRAAKVIASTDARFNELALAAVLNWRYEPAQKDGKAVTVRSETPVQFAEHKKAEGPGKRRDY
ncbi:MAG: TonB family protein [bacterium]|nr:TonB family protein [bacterium]